VSGDAHAMPRVAGRRVTLGALAGLAAGLAVGAAVHASGEPAAAGWIAWSDPLGALWTNALRMTVVPLVVAQLVVAIAGRSARRDVGRMGVVCVGLFVALLALGAAFAASLARPVIAGLAFDPEATADLVANAPAAVATPAGSAPGAAGLLNWFVGLVPLNPVQAAADGALLPLIVFTVVFALALTRLPEARRRPVVEFFGGVGDAMLVIIRWLMLVAWLGVFALSSSMAARTGLGAAGAVGSFILLVSGVMLAFAVLMYPLAVIVGHVRPGDFAAAVAPAQTVAVSTRSSLASLPALIEGAQQRLRLSTHVAGFVLPLCVSSFKVNRTLSSTTKLLFLAAMFGVALTPAQVATFVVTVMLLSFSSPGLPGGSNAMPTLPAYLAVGIPIEGYLLIKAVDVIPDIFKTLVNVTANMAVVVIVARFAGQWKDDAATAPAAGGTRPVPAAEATDA
jgi:Na+/H+-dicarboxylate symporter